MSFEISDAVDLVNISIQDMFLKAEKQETKDYERYFNTESGTTDYYLKDSSLAGLGYAGRVTENAAITSIEPIQGYDQTYTQISYGAVLPVTKMMWFFGIKKRKLEGIAQQLRRACSVKRERLCADRLDNSFSTSYTVEDISGNYSATVAGGNSVALISASQTREDGGTNNGNRITDGSTVFKSIFAVIANNFALMNS